MSNLKARRNALVDMEVENIRKMERNSSKETDKSSPSKSAGDLSDRGSPLPPLNERTGGSNYESSEMSEEIVVTTDDECSAASLATPPILDYTSTTRTHAADCYPMTTTAAIFPEKPLPLSTRRAVEGELNNNGLSNCNLLMNLPERDIQATIEKWQEMATLAALRYGATGMDPEKLLSSVPTALPLHQQASLFTRYDKNRIL